MDPSHATKYKGSEIELIVARLLNKAYPQGVVIPIDVDLLVQQQPEIDDIIPAESLEDRFHVAAALVFKPTNRTFDIFVDEDTYTRQRGRASFSIAHEFGHVVLHADVCHSCSTLNATLALRARLRRSYCRIEQDADAFASGLLMPSQKVLQDAAKLYEGLVGMYKYDVTLIPHKILSNLANAYKVSYGAMNVRLKRLRLDRLVREALRSNFPYLDLGHRF